MSDSLFENSPSMNQTMRTTQPTCQTLPSQQIKQVLITSSSPLAKSIDSSGRQQITDTNNIYEITNQIQQRSIDMPQNHHSYMNDDAIIEEYQKLDHIPSSRNASRASFQNPADLLKQPQQRNGSPSFSSGVSLQSIIQNQPQQNRIQFLEKELLLQQQKYMDLFYNFTNSNETMQNHVKNMIELEMGNQMQQSRNNSRIHQDNQEIATLQAQVNKAGDINKDLIQKLMLQQKQNEQLKIELQLQNDKLLKQHNLLNGPVLRQTQIREEVRKEIESKLVNQHRQEMNTMITRFSREKAMMIKTIELQKLRILDNERIMLQMEGDLENIKESYESLLEKQQQQKQQQQKNNSYEIPEEQTLNKSDQSDVIIESAKSGSIISSVSSVRKLTQKLFSPSSSNTLRPKTVQKHHRKNKSYENHNNQMQSVKQPQQSHQSTHNLNTNNTIPQGVYQNTSHTNLPSSQASSGRNHHQRFSSISTPQSIPASDIYRVSNLFDFYSPERPFMLNQKTNKSSSHSKHLSQTQTTCMSSKSISKQMNLTQSQTSQPPSVKRQSINNGLFYEPKVSHQFVNMVKNSQQYQSPYSLHPNQTPLQAPGLQASTLTPLSEQLSLRSSYNNLQKSGLVNSNNLNNNVDNHGLISPDNELADALNIDNKKSNTKKLNSHLVTPTSLDHTQRVQNISHLNCAQLQGDSSVFSSQSSPVVNVESSLQIFNRFKNTIDHLNQI